MFIVAGVLVNLNKNLQILILLSFETDKLYNKTS